MWHMMSGNLKKLHHYIKELVTTLNIAGPQTPFPWRTGTPPQPSSPACPCPPHQSPFETSGLSSRVFLVQGRGYLVSFLLFWWAGQAFFCSAVARNIAGPPLRAPVRRASWAPELVGLWSTVQWWSQILENVVFFTIEKDHRILWENPAYVAIVDHQNNLSLRNMHSWKFVLILQWEKCFYFTVGIFLFFSGKIRFVMKPFLRLALQLSQDFPDVLRL